MNTYTSKTHAQAHVMNTPVCTHTRKRADVSTTTAIICMYDVCMIVFLLVVYLCITQVAAERQLVGDCLCEHLTYKHITYVTIYLSVYRFIYLFIYTQAQTRIEERDRDRERERGRVGGGGGGGNRD